MTVTVLYNYIGTNGTILSPVHLEDIYYIRRLRLGAEEGKKLTKDGKNFVTAIVIPEDELEQWREI